MQVEKNFEISDVPIDQTQRLREKQMMEERNLLHQGQSEPPMIDENFTYQNQGMNNYYNGVNPDYLINQVKQNNQPKFKIDQANKIQNQSVRHNFVTQQQQQNQQVAQNQFVFQKNIPSSQSFQFQNQQQGQIQNNTYPSTQSFNFQQQSSGTLICRQHNSLVSLICFSKNCQEYSRLVCTQCIIKKFHQDHLDSLVTIEEIQKLNDEDYLSTIGTISEKIKQIEQKGENYFEENIEDIENQLSILEKEFIDMLKQVKKNILMQVAENNSTQSEEMFKSLTKIKEMFSCYKLKQAIAQFLDSPQLQDEKVKLEETIKGYAIIYNSNQLLEDLLPKKKLQVNIGKLEQVNFKLQEAIDILYEVTTTLEEVQLKFQASQFEESPKYLAFQDQGLTIRSQAQNIAVAFTQKPIVANQNYNILVTVQAGDISTHICWGVLLVKEKYVKDTQNLVWISQEKGVFCCFDGDCNQTCNSLQSETKVSQKLLCKQFYININQKTKLFQIVSKDKVFNYSLKDSKQICENEKYYLGLALFKDLKVNIKVDL